MDNEKSPSSTGSPEKNKWDILKDSSRGDDTERLLERARRYRKVGKVALALSRLEPAETVEQNTVEEIQETPDTVTETLESPEDLQSDALIEQIEEALEGVDKSLRNQIEYAIINHKQINTLDALRHELESGSGIPELDIRFDKDGKPGISHSPRAGARFFFSKPIHTLSSEEVASYGQRLSLKDGLGLIREYYEDNPDHKMVLEIKELGPSRDTQKPYLETIKGMLEESGLAETAIFATLSPSVLRAIHDVFPDNSKILNGGICPIISYDIAGKSLEETPSDREFAVKAPNLELFFSNSTEITDRPDGYGKQTGYLWTRLPKETVDTLAGMNRGGRIGAASLTLVNMFANVLDKLGPRAAKKIREHYAGELDRLGLQKQVAISKKNPAENLMKTREQMGENTVFYSDKSPGDWAGDLPEKPEQ